MEGQENITPVDQFVIDYILTLRKTKNISQDGIANLLGVKRSFIGNIENTNSRAKYNLRHINILADYFDLSPRDFLPEKPLDHFYPGREKKIIAGSTVTTRKKKPVSGLKTKINKRSKK